MLSCFKLVALISFCKWAFLSLFCLIVDVWDSKGELLNYVPMGDQQGEQRRAQAIKASSPQASWYKNFCPRLFLVWTRKMANFAGSYPKFHNWGEDVLGTHSKLKNSEIQWNKCRVIWTSFAKSNWATKSSYPDSALACAGFRSSGLVHFNYDSSLSFLSSKWCYNIYQVFP